MEWGASVCAGADFCQELSGSPDTTFRRVYAGDPEGRIIARSRHLSLLVDLSPLCVGHLLIASNAHYLSFAEVLSDHGDEVVRFWKRVLERYAEVFGTPVVLEHGSFEGMDGSACITHAHWHVLPLALRDIDGIIKGDGLPATELGHVRELASLTGKSKPYFYCADGSRHLVYAATLRMPRQYLRSVAGRLLGIPDPEWDYAVVVRKEVLRRTLALAAPWRTTV
jgi:diadenosine tetraphosphate (Ap4A) HIT family hydrolase